jgi:hypothetical protein
MLMTSAPWARRLAADGAIAGVVETDDEAVAH